MPTKANNIYKYTEILSKSKESYTGNDVDTRDKILEETTYIRSQEGIENTLGASKKKLVNRKVTTLQVMTLLFLLQMVFLLQPMTRL